jgi:hypothetical protein
LHIVGQTVEPIRRTRSIDTLMGSLVIVVAYPVVETLTGIGKRCERRLTQKLAPQCLPEPFDLTQSHRMVWGTTHVLDPLLFQHSLKTRLATPCNKLPAIVG